MRHQAARMRSNMRLPSILVALLTVSLVSSACSSDGNREPASVAIAAPLAPEGQADDSVSDPTAISIDDDPESVAESANPARSLWPIDPSTLDPDAPPMWTVEIIESYPHDPEAFTQGLELLANGTVLESTGLRGFSTIRLVDLQSGEVIARAELTTTEFGEGVTQVGDTVIQLTWQEEVARRWRLPDLTPLDPFAYDGEGWGLCLADDRLAMSDGSSDLEWRDPETFDVLETVVVQLRGEPVAALNELECIDDHVFANVWFSDFLVVIRSDGAVVATIDASELVTITAVEMSGDVLNGVADLGDGTLLLGGKRWPRFYRVRLVAE